MFANHYAWERWAFRSQLPHVLCRRPPPRRFGRMWWAIAVRFCDYGPAGGQGLAGRGAAWAAKRASPPLGAVRRNRSARRRVKMIALAPFPPGEMEVRYRRVGICIFPNCRNTGDYRYVVEMIGTPAYTGRAMGRSASQMMRGQYSDKAPTRGSYLVDFTNAPAHSVAEFKFPAVWRGREWGGPMWLPRR